MDFTLRLRFDVSVNTIFTIYIIYSKYSIYVYIYLYRKFLMARDTHYTISIHSCANYFQSDDILFLYNIVFLFTFVTGWIHIWTELHISWNRLEIKYKSKLINLSKFIIKLHLHFFFEYRLHCSPCNPVLNICIIVSYQHRHWLAFL